MSARRFTSTPDLAGDLLRVLGGLLLASGAVALFIRKTSVDSWGDFGQWLVLLIPCALFYFLAFAVARGHDPRRVARSTPTEEGAPAAPWRSVLLVFAIFLTPLALFQFLALVDGSTGDSLNATWIFALTAVLAAAGAYRLGTSFAALLGALAVVIAWLSLWDKITDPAPATLRYLLLIIGVLLVAVAVLAHLARLRWAVELVTAAGIALVAAGLLGVGATVTQVVTGGFGGLFGVPATGGLEQQNVWNVFLLVVSLALIVLGTDIGRRGPTYVGGFGLLAFIVSVGLEVARVGSGEGPEGKLLWWPLLLVVLGAGGLAAGFLLRGGGARAAGEPTAAASPPVAPPRPPPT